MSISQEMSISTARAWLKQREPNMAESQLDWAEAAMRQVYSAALRQATERLANYHREVKEVTPRSWEYSAAMHEAIAVIREMDELEAEREEQRQAIERVHLDWKGRLLSLGLAATQFIYLKQLALEFEQYLANIEAEAQAEEERESE